MAVDSEVHTYDDDAADAYCAGDVPLEDIDPADLERTAAVLEQAQAQPEGEERSWAVLGALHELYGDDLEVL